MLIALDTETHLLGPGNVIPKLVCTSFAYRNKAVLNSDLLSTVDDLHYEAIEECLTDMECVFHNCGFDLTVFVRKYPKLMPIVFKALEENRIYDTQIREKLLMLSTHGNLSVDPVTSKPLKFSLADLAKKYLGIDISGDKTDEDSWRFHYDKLDGTPVKDYPKEAYDYAIEDAAITLQVFEAQEELAQSSDGYASMQIAWLHCQAAFCMRLMTAWGFKCDLERKAQLEEQIKKDLSEDNLKLLVGSGILRPALPPRPYANRARDKDGDLKLKAAQPESIDTKKLKARIEYVCNKHELPVKMTAPSTRFPNGSVSADKEVMQTLYGLDDVLDQYHLRAEWQSVLTRELPHMSGPVVHPEYDVLKSTERSSSFASKLYPSTNIQSKDPRVRPCFVPRKGKLLFSIDYSSLELCTFAQLQYKLFKSSLLGDLINAGHCPHAYMGSRLSYNLDEEFSKHCGTTDIEKIFEQFVQMAELAPDYYKYWRTFAKPVGLGFPGGLGPETMVAFAKATYQIDMNVDQARQVRQLWLDSFPEAAMYFEYIKEKCSYGDNNFFYTSPLGFHRRGCTYSAACNGFALQTPAAEGFKIAVNAVVRACYDTTINSILLGTKPIGAIHDEIVGEVADDEEAPEKIEEIQRIMEKGMAIICPDVTIRTEACLMRRWYKEAKPVKDAHGRLSVWEPETTKE